MPQQIARFEVAVGIADDQHAGLVGEQLAAGGEGPDHAEQQRRHARDLAKFITSGIDVPSIEISLARKK